LIMNIWFDISNSPHINMFYALISQLEQEGHTIIITSRPLANTIDLLDQKGLTHKIVGKHYGKNILGKLFGYPIRVFQLWQYLKDKKIDLAVSQSSFHSPLTAKLLGVSSIYTNDNEHALGNLPSFFFATKILLPERFNLNMLSKSAMISRKVNYYPGVKEGIYLWRMSRSNKLKDISTQPARLKLYIRPEPSTAQYYNGKLNFLDELINELSTRFNIFILPRSKEQTNHYLSNSFKNISVADKPISFEQIANDCDLFIGAGGSMTRELAMIGIPTISVYQGELLEVDKLLIENDLMHHAASITSTDVISLSQQLPLSNQKNSLMAKGKLAYDMLYNTIINTNKSITV
jgi:predicted glycosyltransferase